MTYDEVTSGDEAPSWAARDRSCIVDRLQKGCYLKCVLPLEISPLLKHKRDPRSIHHSSIHPQLFTKETTAIMSGNSSVGQASVYEAGDQRNYKASEINQADPYNEGKVNSHDTLDSSMFLWDSAHMRFE